LGDISDGFVADGTPSEKGLGYGYEEKKGPNVNGTSQNKKIRLTGF
jgi:hypothetical protein